MNTTRKRRRGTTARRRSPRGPGAIAALGLALPFALSPSFAFAYVGPGAGLGVLGTLFGLLAAVVLGLLGFLWYPLKRLLARRRGPTTTASDDAATPHAAADVTPQASVGADTGVPANGASGDPMHAPHDARVDTKADVKAGTAADTAAGATTGQADDAVPVVPRPAASTDTERRP